MSRSVYKSEEGRRLIEAAYRMHLDSALGAGLVQRRVETVQGSTFVLEKSGAGKPPLLLLHGSVSNSASWLGVIPLFAEHFSVYCLDIPGEPEEIIEYQALVSKHFRPVNEGMPSSTSSMRCMNF